MHARTWAAMVAVVVGGLWASSASAQLCDAPALSGALALAAPGEVVQVGDCTVSGSSFIVPAGVTLEGTTSLSGIAIPPGGAGVWLLPNPTVGGAPTTLRSLTVQSAARGAIVALGAGAARVQQVSVDATRGIGIGAQGLSSLVLDRVVATGPVTAASAPTIPVPADRDVTATFGVVIIDVASADVRDLSVGGFATAGVLTVRGATQWTGGVATGNVGAGLFAFGGDVNLSGVQLDGQYRGARVGSDWGAGLLATGGAYVDTVDTDFTRNDGWGAFFDGTSDVVLDRARIDHNTHAGVWMQAAGGLQIDDSTVSHDGVVGVVAIASDIVSMSGTRVQQARGTAPPGLFPVGDGIELDSTRGDFSGVSLVGNTRVGLIADLGDALLPSDMRFDAVTVVGPVGALGIVLQKNGVPLPLPTTGIRRLGTTARADAAWATRVTGLDLAGIIDPELMPVGAGIAGIIDPELNPWGLALLLGQQQQPPPPKDGTPPPQ